MYAQVGIGKINPINLVVVNGAKIYSTDDHFNQQIFAGKTLVKNSSISYISNEKKDRSLLLTERKSVDVKKNLSNQLIVAQEKRRKNDLKKLRKEIKKHAKLNFSHFDFNSTPVGSEFFSSNTSAKNYIAPNHSNTDFSKCYISLDKHSVNIALYFLHSQTYTYFNNKSLSNFFAEVFSVRPPPQFFL